MAQGGNEMKKYIIIDLLAGIMLCILSGFFVFILNRLNLSKEKIDIPLEVITTVTGSFYICLILLRVKTKDFGKKLTKENVRKIVQVSCILLFMRLIGSVLYPLMQDGRAFMAYIVTGLIDLVGIIMAFILLPNKKKIEKLATNNSAGEIEEK